jgi:hypothetical protein
MTILFVFFSDIFLTPFCIASALAYLACRGFLRSRYLYTVCQGLRLCENILVSALSSLGGNVSNLVLSDVVCVPFYACVGMRRIVLRVYCSMLWLALGFYIFDSFFHLRVSCIGILDSWFVCGGGCLGQTQNNKTFLFHQKKSGRPEILCLFLR